LTICLGKGRLETFPTSLRLLRCFKAPYPQHQGIAGSLTGPVGRRGQAGISLGAGKRPARKAKERGRGTPVSGDGSVTRWLERLQSGDQAAARELWERYFRRLAALARLKLQGSPRRAANEEDVALSAFASFCRGVERGRFPQLFDRDGLWRLLVVFTVRKAAHQLRDEGRLKRRGKCSDNGAPDALPDEAALEQVMSREPTPEIAAEMAERVRVLLASLNDAELETVAVWKMEGFTNDEIAARLDCAPRTVERKLRLIRCIWEKELAP
jgi:DNA-directed RNA polymerase specialized sigma24 family protein